MYDKSGIIFRLKYFAYAMYDSNLAVFAKELGYNARQSLHPYAKGEKEIGNAFIKKFINIGGNPAWMDYNQGLMFANNELGHIGVLYHDEIISKFMSDDMLKRECLNRGFDIIDKERHIKFMASESSVKYNKKD